MRFLSPAALLGLLMWKALGVFAEGECSTRAQAYTMDFGPYIGDLVKALSPSSGRGCNMIIGPLAEVSVRLPLPRSNSRN